MGGPLAGLLVLVPLGAVVGFLLPPLALSWDPLAFAIADLLEPLADLFSPIGFIVVEELPELGPKNLFTWMPIHRAFLGATLPLMLFLFWCWHRRRWFRARLRSELEVFRALYGSASVPESEAQAAAREFLAVQALVEGPIGLDGASGEHAPSLEPQMGRSARRASTVR